MSSSFMVSCASFSSSPLPTVADHDNISRKQDDIRHTMNFDASIWGDQFLTYHEKEDLVMEKQLVEELKEEVRKELKIRLASNEPMQHMKLIELIDVIQRLGIAYHFEEEIEEALQQIYGTYDEHKIANNNLQSASLWFRILRQQGFNVSPVPNFGIEPLSGANFASWKDQLLLTLGMLDLDYAIRHDEPAAITAESSAAQKADFEKWEKANRLSLMMIKNSINLSIRGAIPDSDKVKTYLSSVEDHFKGSSKTHASNLMLQMLTLKYEGHSGVREHIMKMTDMAHKLKSLEMEVSDNFLVHFIMTSLPARFDTFKVNYNAMKDKWSISELIAMCGQEEDRLKLGQPEAVHLTTATNSNKRKGNYGNKTANKVQKANQGAVASGPNPSTSKPNCKFCRAKGHGQKDCSKFKEWLAKKGIPYNPEATKGPKKT